MSEKTVETIAHPEAEGVCADGTRFHMFEQEPIDHKTAPSDDTIYVWFADSDQVGTKGDRFIRAWTHNPERVDGLSRAIGRDPFCYVDAADAATPMRWTEDQIARAWFDAEYGPGHTQAPGYVHAFLKLLAPTSEQAEGVRVAELEREIAALKAEAEQKEAKSKELANMLANIMHDQTVAMQSALIEWKHGNGAEAGLQWIVNTLMGPGLLPDFDAEHGTNAQFWFDANQSQPMPKCFCGNPSHIGWLGQGFCSNAHYDQAKAKHDAAASAGDQS